MEHIALEFDSAMNITQLVRLRRRCVFGALVGYIFSGILTPFSLLHPSLLVLAIPIVLLSFFAERGHCAAAIIQAALTILAIGFIVWVWFGASTKMYWALITLPVIGAAGMIGTVGWSLVSALRYNRALPARARTGSRTALSLGVERKLAFLRSRRFPTMASYFALSMIMIGAPMLALGHLHRVFMAEFRSPSLWWIPVGIVGFLGCLEASRWAFARAKRLAALSATQARRRDSRLPVLLLRSFCDDITPVEPKFSARTCWRGPAAVRQRTLEECLEEALWRYGPVIAVGRPGETLPPAGAAREYLPDDAWRNKIREHIAEAAVIVVILGSTEGLRDEYRMLAECEAMGKLVAVFPPVDADRRSARWAVFAEAALSSASGTLSDLSQALLAQPTEGGSVRLITCDWQDEECYVLALRCSLG